MAGKASTKIVKKTTLVKKKRTEDSEINFKLSWMTKLKHEDFLYKASTLFRLTELFMRHKIKPTSDINVDWMFDNVKANIDKMQSMPPKQMGHDLTKTIRELHAKRKGMLTGIRGYLKTIIKFPNANVPNHQMAAHTIAFWLQNIYGTRHYDFGITELSGRMRGMFLTFDRDEELQQAFETCGQTYAMSELRRVNEELSTAKKLTLVLKKCSIIITSNLCVLATGSRLPRGRRGGSECGRRNRRQRVRISRID